MAAMAKQPAFTDMFGPIAKSYAKARPTYPTELYDFIYSLPGLGADLCCDVGTGSGQAAYELAQHFNKVIAFDPSLDQLKEARQHPKVEYRHAPAENFPSIENSSVDLVTAATCAHWFADIQAFYREAFRVLKPGGYIVLWTYSPLITCLDPDINMLLADNRRETYNYVPIQGLPAIDQYRSLPFAFPEVAAPGFSCAIDWQLDQLIAFMDTQTQERNYVRAQGKSSTCELKKKLSAVWPGGEGARVRINVPLSMRAGKKPVKKM